MNGVQYYAITVKAYYRKWVDGETSVGSSRRSFGQGARVNQQSAGRKTFGTVGEFGRKNQHIWGDVKSELVEMRIVHIVSLLVREKWVITGGLP